MSLLRTKLATAFDLGLFDILNVLTYKFGNSIGLSSVRKIRSEVPRGPFFQLPKPTAVNSVPRKGWFDYQEAFGVVGEKLSDYPPDWFVSSESGKRLSVAHEDWWQIPDFDAAVGDIKTVWEASRFDWVLAHAQQSLSDNGEAYPRLEQWLGDWCVLNPPYKGPNWKCGQEASIRVMHLAMAALMLDQTKEMTCGMRALLTAHLKRIAPTIRYAMAQNNNHGTSEAAALFIGGSWLSSIGDQQGERWQLIGRKWLENRAERLIESDGSFSQYSVNYHRVVLDTMTMVELWRKALQLDQFSRLFYERVGSATTWLYTMTLPGTGDAPNLGANDGARLLPLTDTDFRDYRPSIQLASAVFLNLKAYGGEGSWNSPLHWMRISVPSKSLPIAASAEFNDGGFAVLRQDDVMLVLRYPRFRFRPGQADALHLDFWLKGKNWLRDAGTFSYAHNSAMEYFHGTESHNTVQFDGRDQMPKLSRFLYGDWIKTSSIEHLVCTNKAQSFSAGYIDGKGCKHVRRVELKPGVLVVTDEVDGFGNKAVLRWRLIPTDWEVDATNLRCGEFCINVTASSPLCRFELVSGWESRYYLRRIEIPVLEIEINKSATITTEIRWLYS